jgi:ABC-type antimicrobial peptide transport system permease subunit
MNYWLQPLFKCHFYDEKNQPNSNMQNCKLFTIAVFVLLIMACINYVNLVTARLSKRIKSIFIKQIWGAKKIGIFFESMLETSLLFIISLCFATLFIYLLFPIFNEISEKQMVFTFFSKETLSIFGLTFLVVMIFAGLFPAILLASRNPLNLMQGFMSKKRGNLILRRLLVIVQFGSAVALIMSSIIITRQMKYLQEKDLGYNPENIIEITLSKGMMQQMQSLKSELLKQPEILGVTNASQGVLFSTQGAGWKDSLIMYFIKVDGSFIPTMDMDLVAGRNFSDTPADSCSYILNETSVKATGISDPIGKKFDFMKGEGTIIGVVKDFHFDKLDVNIKPLALYTDGIQPFLYVRLLSENREQALEKIEKICKQYNGGMELQYAFMSEMLNKAYLKDQRTNKLFNIFAIIAILISCLGLFGLVTYTAETKTKEIGIRKVMGASVKEMVEMLTMEFLILVGISMLIAFPLVYYWLNRLLQNYAYRVPISWWTFVLASGITLTLTLLTVGFKALKAALANPARAIKKE